MRGRCTLKDIARETGFAKATISNVLNNRKSCFASQATRRKIQEAAERLGYRPDHFARSLRRRESRIIGIMGRALSGEVQNAQLIAVQRAFREAGYLSAFSWGMPEDSRMMEELIQFNVDGLVFLNDRDELALTFNVPENVPCICVGSYPIANVPTVVIDRSEGMRRMVSHVVEIGHRNIALAFRKFKFNAGKINGYQQAMKEAGLEANIRMIQLTEEIGEIPRSIKTSAAQFEGITAIVTNSDHVAVEMLPGLRALGLRIPEDCSVAGFNGARVSLSVEPRISTCKQQTDQIAKAVVEMLKAQIEGNRPENRVFVPDLVLRESIVPPPKRPKKIKLV